MIPVKNFFKVITLFVLLFSFDYLSAAGSRASFTRGGFAGARYNAMGMAAEVSVNDAFAVYWNPAGLIELKGTRKMTSEEIQAKASAGTVGDITEHDLLAFTDEQTDMFVFQIAASGAMLDYARNAGFAAVAFNAFSGVFGAGLYTIGTDGIEGRDDSGNFTHDITYTAAASYLSYGWSSGPANIGMSVKGLYEKIDGTVYSGAGADIGTQISVLPFIKVGFVIQDLGTFMYPVSGDTVVEKEYDFADASLRLGASITSDSGVMFAFGLAKRYEEDRYIFSFGIEYNLTDWLDVYAGMRDELFSAGTGLKLWNMDIGYSMSIDRVDYGFNNLVSLLMKF